VLKERSQSKNSSADMNALRRVRLVPAAFADPARTANRKPRTAGRNQMQTRHVHQKQNSDLPVDRQTPDGPNMDKKVKRVFKHFFNNIEC
jgi:chloramphenicol 3-O-phosphotransferase